MRFYPVPTTRGEAAGWIAYSLVGYDSEVNRLQLLQAVAQRHLGVVLLVRQPQPDRSAS